MVLAGSRLYKGFDLCFVRITICRNPGTSTRSTTYHKDGIARKWGGTWACEQLAVAYANWISPEFYLLVINTFIAVKKGVAQGVASNRAEYLQEEFRSLVSFAGLFGLSGNQALLSADKGVKALTGISPMAMLGITHLKADEKGMTYTPTELGKMVEPPQSGQKINKLLEAAGLQVMGTHKHWIPSEKAGGLFEWLDTGKKHNSGTPIKQVKWFKETIGSLQLTATKEIVQ